MKYFINEAKALKLDIEHLAEADAFISGILKQARISKVTVNECRVIFEEIFSRVAEEYKESDKAAYVAVRRKFGQLEICFAFEGERAVIDLDKRGFDDLGLTILSRYRDRLNFLYRRGINEIRISIKESSMFRWLMFVGAFVVAGIVGLILTSTLDKGECVHVVKTYIAPAEGLFGNGLLLLSTPLVFLSLIRNVTTVFSYSDNNFKVRKTIFRVLFMSAYSAVAGILAFLIIKYISVETNGFFGRFTYSEDMDYSWLTELVTQFIPSNILDLLSADTSVPLVVFAMVFAAAVCYSGKYFDLLKNLIDAIYVVFSKMLSMLMVLLPLAMCLALLNDTLMYGFETSLERISSIAMLGLIGVVILFVFLLVRFAIRGTNPFLIIKLLKDAVPTNLKINSTINAVPFNTRYCVKKIGIDIRKLEAALPIMAQINQVGNCFFLTFLPLYMLTMQGIAINVPVLIAIASLSIILSIGAPGQPGTIMIGMLVIMSLIGLNTTDYMYTLIYVEVFFGWAMTFFNTFGDLGEITMEHIKTRRKEEAKQSQH